ncbi:MAG: hypothetical protein U1E65_33915 [Myxococcota bacterium]
MPRPLPFIAAIAALGCSPTPPTVLGLPAEGLRSWIFAFERPERPETDRYVFVALEDPGAAVHFLSTRPASTLFALGYDRSLSELGLVAGTLPAAAACARSCEVDRPLRSFALPYNQSTAAWSEVASVTPAVFDLLIPDHATRCNEGCLSITSTFASNGPSPITAVVSQRPSLDAEATRAVLLRADGAMFESTGPGVLRPLCGAGQLQPTAAFLQAGASSLWVATADGRLGTIALDRVEPAAPCALDQEILRVPPAIVRLGGPLTGPITALHAITSTGALGRIVGTTYTPLRALKLQDQDLTTRYGFVVEHQGTVFATPGGIELAVVRGDHITVLTTEAQIVPVHLVSATVYRDQLYIAARRSNLLTVVDEHLVGVPGSAVGDVRWSSPNGLAALQGRLVASAKDGEFAQWSPATGYCPSQTVGQHRQDGSQTAVVGGSFMVGDTSDPGVQDNQIWWLTPTKSERCAPH